MIQALILLLGASAIACIASKNERVQFWGFVFGTLSEPLWLYEAWRTGQWGIVVLALWWGGFYFVGMVRRF